jgi:hypothetical protein
MKVGLMKTEMFEIEVELMKITLAKKETGCYEENDNGMRRNV